MEIKIRRTIAILLALCFLISITCAVASATQAQYDHGYSDGKARGESDAAANKPAKKKFFFKLSNSKDYNNGFVDGYNRGYYGDQISQQQMISQQQTNTPVSSSPSGSGSSIPNIQAAGVGSLSRDGGIAGATKGCNDGKADKGLGKFLKTPAEGGNYAPRSVDPLYPEEYKKAYLEAYTTYYEKCYFNP